MEILATARLKYNDGESISSGWEGLMLIVTFKEKGKLFRTKLKNKIVTTFYIHDNNPLKPYTYDDYFQDCYKYINDDYLVKKEVDKMIKVYFNQNKHAATVDEKRNKIKQRIQQQDKLEIVVKIK